MSNTSSSSPPAWYRRPRFIAAVLFVVALLPRLPGLGRFLTSDENTNIFFAGSDVIAALLQGDLRGTYWHFYPGVTMSWLDAIGMSSQYLLDRLTGQPVPAFNEYIYGDILSLVIANRVPYAALTALAVAAMYLLSRHLVSNRVALFGALLLATDPFYLAHSRVAHGDAPVAVFMSLSALTFFIYANRIRQDNRTTKTPSDPNPTDTPPLAGGTEGGGNRHLTTTSGFLSTRARGTTLYLVASAILGSMAALTKAPGQFMALFIIGLSLIYAVLELRTTPDRFYVFRRWATVVMIWGLVSLAVFILIWPSMWVDPVGTFQQMWNETFGKVNEGHLVYFFGQPTLDPGFWFYFYVIPFRLTPLILIGSLLSLFLFIPRVRSFTISNLPKQHGSPISPSPLFLLWLFTLTLLLFGNLSPKKQDRYLLPLFPFLNLIAAIGWLATIDLFLHFFKRSITNYQLLNTDYRSLFTGLLLLIHLLPTLTYYPYYLTYFNPLLGGPTRAAETTLMGWGEGMEQVAAYLNAKPNAAELYVASTPSQTLLPYFAGTGENFYTNDIAFRADYVVLYLAQMQRLAPSPEIVHYFSDQIPEATITIHGVPYAKIYPGPKLILPDIPAEATPLNIGLADTLRLAGYTIAESQTATPSLTLYWHALAPFPLDYTISVRARAEDGTLLSQQDSWPVQGLLPTTQWRPGDYVTDAYQLDLSPSNAGPVALFEIVVYHLESGETLGSPITIPVSGGSGS